MPQPTGTESTEVGAGVEPGTAAVGSTAWAVHSAARALRATGVDPLRAAERRKLVLGFEIAERKNICSDYIADCFEFGKSDDYPAYYPIMGGIGSVRWAIKLLVREVVAKGDVPKGAAVRRKKILEFEVLQGREINEELVDFIADCFTDVLTSESQGFDTESREPAPALNLDYSAMRHPSPVTRSRMQYSRAAVSQVISNQPSLSTRADQSDAFKISLRRDSGLPDDGDIVVAQWRDGERNYILRRVAKRQGLQIESDTVQGFVGMFSDCSAPHMARRVTFQVQPDEKKMGDVLLGTEFKSQLEDLEQWETMPTPGEVMYAHYQPKPPGSVSSHYNESYSTTVRNDYDSRFLRETIETMNALRRSGSKNVDKPPIHDSAYSSIASSSRSEQRAPP